ncbi:ABC-2 type transport system permease protein [Thalassobacillus cyri]|uniref:ABC-2 type transport system permease protein n=1 Tax=Thalassobacillus cyri TaxID=571932 RepID=A0A1H4CDI2_9BACI|nr:DUF6449 domain-containing protein [Thalassobacillus cyri]SEA58434.1 ABC-2 type transport system permease protein [Thalassobacillus cyri]
MWKTSSFKKEVTKQNFRSVGWIGIIYLIGLLFAMPLRIMMELSSDRPFQFLHENGLFQINFEIQQVMMIIIPVLLGIFLFRYLQVKETSDFVHSLPLKRTELYHNNVWNGMVILVAPIIINAAVMTILYISFDLSYVYSLEDIWYWLGGTLSVTLLLFFAAVFVGMVTGLTAVHGVLTYIMLLFPAGITVLLYFAMNQFLYGFSENYYMDQNLHQLSPLVDSLNLYNASLPASRMYVYLAIGAAFYGLAWKIYQHRNMEMAGQAIVYGVLRPIFKYGLTLCMMLVGGLYFQNHPNTTWIVFGYMAGAVSGYAIAEMVLQKTWRVFSAWKGFIGYAAAAGLVFLLLQLDITGFEQRVPAAAKVDRVFIGEGSYSYQNNHPYNESGYLNENENIQAVTKLHKQIISSGSEEYRIGRRNLFLAYEMKNGETMVREYMIPEQDYRAYLDPIYESLEYKALKYPVMKVEPENIDRIRFFTDYASSDKLVVAEPEEIETLMSRLKQDLQAETYEDMIPSLGDRGDISFLLDSGMEVHIPMKRSYGQLNEWLKQKGLYEGAVLTDEDVSKAVIVHQNEPGGPIYNEFKSAAASNEHVWTVKDNQKIKLLLNSKEYQGQGRYFVGIYPKGGEPLIYRISEDLVARVVN